MKKINILFSLTSIALLVSCGSKNDVLKPCNENVASQVANSILYEQRAAQDTRLSSLYPTLYQYMPTSVKKFTTTINVETKYIQAFSETTKEESVQTINKVCSLDLNKMCYTCDYDSYYSYSQNANHTHHKYYLFFVLDEVQEKDVKEENRLGTIYELLESGGAKRLLNKIYTTPKESQSSATTYEYFMDTYLTSAISDGYQLSSYNFSCNDMYRDDSVQLTEDFIINQTYWYPNDGIYQSNLLGALYSQNIQNWDEAHAMLASLGKNELYFNPRYASNDPFSLSVNLDSHLEVIYSLPVSDTNTISFTGPYNKKAYIEFKDFCCSKATFDQTFESTSTKFNETELKSAKMSQSDHMDRTNDYGVANCSIPSDIDQYV